MSLDSLPPSLKRGIDVIRSFIKLLPKSPGVYRMVNTKDEVLYVGKAKNLYNRLSSYTHEHKLTTRLKRMVAQTAFLEVIHTHTEVEALLLEANLIKKFRPPFNVLLRDDKSFPYILIAKDHPYPQILPYRGEKKRTGLYFGPFASAQSVYETLPLLQRGFLLRSCSDTVFANRARPCLLYHIKRCSAPCVGKISEEKYNFLVQEADNFLSGKTTYLQKQLSKKMQEASLSLNYEEAARYRDRLRILTQIQASQRVAGLSLDRTDVIAIAEDSGEVCLQFFLYKQGNNLGNKPFFFKKEDELSLSEIMGAFLMQFYTTHEVPSLILLNYPPQDKKIIEEALTSLKEKKVNIVVPKFGPKKELVSQALKNAELALARHLTEKMQICSLFQKLQVILNSSNPIERIEVFDNSHLQGKDPYGAMIVVDSTGFVKQSYRKFHIKDAYSSTIVKEGDDYGMMHQVLLRRFKNIHTLSENKPSLVLLDGGKGQLSVGLKVFEDLGITDITLAAIAKGPNRNAGEETFYLPYKDPFQLPKQDPLLFFLQKIRDEAHRFAISTHRAKRSKTLVRSKLDTVPNIGPKRKKALLHHFGSAQAIQEAALMDLKKVPGISPKLAQSIYSYFHE